VSDDKINHPQYYTQGIECLDYIMSHGLDFCEGNVVKYVTRHKLKNGVEDLAKAKFYLSRLIAQYGQPQNYPLRIYIAGPYTSDSNDQVGINISIARRVSALLLAAGHLPYCPHTHTAHYEELFPEIEYDTYMEHGLAFQRLCDCLFVLPRWKESKGAMREVEQARSWMQPCYFRMADVPTVEGYPAPSDLCSRYSIQSLQ
jgi:hypothetical protein